MRATISSSHHTRAGRTYAAVTVYLVVFALLVLALVKWYLVPGLRAAQNASHDEREKLAANALLVLIVVLFALMAGLVLTFRVSRFFFPRPTPPRHPTQYTDAWAESAKRMQTPPEE
jgi:hypothetical protein